MFVGRRNILGDNARAVLSALTYFVASPALLFETLSRAKLPDVLAAPLLVSALTMLAAVYPARRAARVNPIAALRHE